jgi:UDP-N-acetylmuramoylalanine--D-glutamate ligase
MAIALIPGFLYHYHMKKPGRVSLKNKDIAVLGFGVEGQSTVKFLHRERAKVTVFDEKKPADLATHALAECELPESNYRYGPFPDLSGYDMIVVSPGIRPDILPLVLARKKKIPVTTGTNLFLDRCPAKTVGITGTKGKGTTSALLTEMLKADGRDTHLGGNIGTPPLDFLDSLDAKSIVVLELSSFQTFTITRGTDIVGYVMTTSDHLDYHTGVDEYIQAKLQLARRQPLHGEVIATIDYENSKYLGDQTGKDYWQVSIHRLVKRGVYVKDGSFFWTDGKVTERVAPTTALFIPGRHNWENAGVAIAAAKILGAENSAIVTGLEQFRGLPHRLEFVRNHNGVTFYDDSFSTTPETAIAAIKAFTQPKILILGGSSKQSDFGELGEAIAQSDSIRAVIGIGMEWKRIKTSIPQQHAPFRIIEDCANMHDIVQAAYEVAQEGDVVLLSPACASFDMFDNYKERGNQFKAEVGNLL